MPRRPSQPHPLSLGLQAAALIVVLSGCASHTSVVLDGQTSGADQRTQGTRGPDKSHLPTVAEKTTGLAAQTGLMKFFVDDRAGRVWLQLPEPDARTGEVGQFIYVDSMRGGLGSNPIGIDRGQLGDSRLVRIRRVGPQVVIERINLRFRALTERDEERQAVAESFASSVLWGGEIGALDEDGSSLVDITSFLVRDAHNISGTLRGTDQGEFSLDQSRSFVELPNCLAFPDNVEFEATLTYSSSRPGRQVRATAAEAGAVTLVQRHSFIRLPDSGYHTRVFDPRIASFAVSFQNYAAEIDKPLATKWISRHRLEKSNPAATQSTPIEPIIYYVDSAAPEPIRSALIEGAGWWSHAFEAAGFDHAFQVQVLPDGIHPLDVRYNVIQWVHRSTRGWSYGGSISDPRTGEIIKGHVSLGSLRVRQDRMIFEGLLGTRKTGTGEADDPVELALSRIRQLAAHEVGHTLGFAHNFAASTYDGRASVMDYPAPLLRVRDDDTIDVSKAYAVGIGSWDKLCVRYAYSEYDNNSAEQVGLAAIAREAIAEHRFVSDSDSRSPGAAHPQGNLWDNGEDGVVELENLLEVRGIALRSFAADRVAAGQPMALLQEVLAPVYFMHRYQMQAVGKSVGGMDYSYAVRGDGQTAARPLDASAQRGAITALVACLDVERLDLPDDVLELIAPRAFGYGSNRELFNGSTDPLFDPIAAAATAADMALTELLQPQRLARMVEFNRRDEAQPSLRWMLEQVVEEAVAKTKDHRLAPLQAGVRTAVVDSLIELARSNGATTVVRAEAERALGLFRLALTGDSAHQALLRHRISRYLNRTVESPLQTDPMADPPPGSPIGHTSMMYDLGGCSAGRW